MNNNRNMTKVFCTAIALLLTSGIAFSSAFASGTESATHEMAEHTTGDMAKEAATEVVDATKEKTIDMAKEQANTAVDSALGQVDETLKPAEHATEAVKEVTH
ncbi:MAG: hypothetical protein KJ804_15830 [Proteobacteria bacterium]|nr:hypothetical protein [Pseudomonadota bacterium]MBU1059782.1 hypothetical protein [Pseudomonadota bacterium]